jgi:hypothetical protein
MQSFGRRLPLNFDRFSEDILTGVADVEGYLSPREMRFLTLLGSVPTADGEVLEIGSFKGKSTIILARSALLAGDQFINAVDPMTAPSETDPDLGSQTSSLVDFERNIAKHEVADRIRLYQSFSHELAKTWDRPLRLLWIDGDHTYEGTRRDFDGFAPHLSDGAIIAIHDVLHEFEGGLRVFLENILLSADYGACGFCGSIAWAQFCANKGDALPWRDKKLRLYRKLTKLVPFVALDRKLGRAEKIRYKVYRSLIPHGAVDPRTWIETIR